LTRHTHFILVPKQLQAKFFKTSHIDKEQPININANHRRGSRLAV